MKNILNILKMQRNESEKLVKSEEKRILEQKAFNDEAKSLDEASDKRLQENKAFLSSLGVNIDADTINEAYERANREIEKIIADIDVNYAEYEKKIVTYEDLVKLAHEKEFKDTTFSELLTKEEMLNAEKRVEEIEELFCAKTKLKKKDLALLTIATAMQVVRQYVFTPLSVRGTAEEAEKAFKDKYDNDGKLGKDYYYASMDTILNYKTVPYDLMVGSKAFDLGGKGKGLSGDTHRFRSLGHDPILGYLFGTANILTNTSTWWNLSSSHIKYKVVHKKNGDVQVPAITAWANTRKIFKAVEKRFDTTEGKLAIVAALIKEHAHLKSDKSTDGLPFPGAQLISPELAQELAEDGLDGILFGDVSKQATLSGFINMIIVTLHMLFCYLNGERNVAEKNLRKVRAKKIILISNSLASSSNVIIVGLGAAAGSFGGNPELLKESIRHLDVGGILLTLTHLFRDRRFIAKVEEEFVNSKLDAAFLEELENLDKYLEI